ncbi:hypothetical protein ABZ741_39245 [Streptomyces globisporus]|uniref:hypothetical protein n=1 Tax=Streptomyces globisporus TaxID=1908 RepID=UPI00345F9070|nr:hypothetical protein OG838_09585 [Streptomyces globisporus]WSV89504.1 hypothetical protein OG449_09160 [Streptomyces globisporus]
MPDETTPEPLTGSALELAKLRAGLTAGLTVEQSARLQGADEAALTADAASFASELSPAPPAPRAGGDRGPDVTGAAGTVSAGVAEYRRKNGLDADGNRPERKPLPTSTRNPFTEPAYRMESR